MTEPTNVELRFALKAWARAYRGNYVRAQADGTIPPMTATRAELLEHQRRLLDLAGRLP